jgi:hypothetical protein
MSQYIVHGPSQAEPGKVNTECLEKAYGIPKVAIDKVPELDRDMKVVVADWEQDGINQTLLKDLDNLVQTRKRALQCVSEFLDDPLNFSNFEKSLIQGDDVKSEAIKIFKGLLKDLAQPLLDLSRVRSNFKEVMETKWALISREHLRNAN